MKIGILTFHRAVNYGAVLQCYALSEYLKNLGHDVYVIDYNNPKLLACYKVFDFHRLISRKALHKVITNSLKEVSLIQRRRERWKKFDFFIKNRLRLLAPTQDNIDQLDIVIVGSDQVWNTNLTNGFDPYYWGSFKHRDKLRIISYAASIEEFWDEKDNELAKKLLENFDAISVREANSSDRLKFLLPNRCISLCLDPTLIVKRQVWDKLVKSPSIKKKYLLLYQVRASKKAYEISKFVAKKLSLKLIVLSANVSSKNSRICGGASPEEYLGLLKNASFIVCTSFHGTVFSLVFGRPFLSIKLYDGRDNRVETLLSQFNGQHRFVASLEDVTNLKDINEIIDFKQTVSKDSEDYILKEIYL